MKGDLSSCFSWNTKQLFAYIKVVYETERHVRNEVRELLSRIKVFWEISLTVGPLRVTTGHLQQVTVWDKVMTSTEEARIEEAFLSKYALVDNGSDLRGRDVNLTLAWNVMPYIGEHLNTFFPPVTQPFYLRCLLIRRSFVLWGEGFCSQNAFGIHEQRTAGIIPRVACMGGGRCTQVNAAASQLFFTKIFTGSCKSHEEDLDEPPRLLLPPLRK